MTRLALPQNYLLASGTVFEDFSSITGWTPAGCTIENATVDGKNCIKVTPTSTTAYLYKTISKNFFNTTKFSLNFKVEGISNLTSLAMLLGNSGVSRYVKATANAVENNFTVHEGWNNYCFAKNSFSETSSPPADWNSNLAVLRIHINSVSSSNPYPYVYLDSIELDSITQTYAMFGVDDWVRADNTDFPHHYIDVLDQYGFKSTFFTCNLHTNNLLAGYWSNATTLELKNQGHGFGLHSVNHNGIDTYGNYNHADNPLSWYNMTTEAIEAELQENIDFMLDLGLIVEGEDLHMATPNGVMSSNIRTAISNLGIKTNRTVGLGLIYNPPNNNLLDIPVVTLDYNTDFDTYVKPQINKAIVTGSGINFFGHGCYSSNAPSGNFNQALLQKVCDCLYQNQIPVVLMKDAYKGLTTGRLAT